MKQKDTPLGKGIVCFGNTVADIIVRYIEDLPSIDVIKEVEDIAFSIGGNAANTAVVLQRLGLQPLLIAKVGSDMFGHMLRGALQREGVSTRHVQIIQGESTAVTISLVRPNGERSFIHIPGANMRLRVQDIPRELLKSSAHLHFSSFSLLPAVSVNDAAILFQEAREYGLTVSFDVVLSWAPEWVSQIKQLLPLVNILFANEQEARKLSGKSNASEAAQALQEIGVPVVVVKLGRKGCIVVSSEQSFLAPAFPAKVVDTTGAGDAFCAGFLAAFLRGWSLYRSALLANLTGAQSTSAPGGVHGVYTWPKILEFLQDSLNCEKC